MFHEFNVDANFSKGLRACKRKYGEYFSGGNEYEYERLFNKGWFYGYIGIDEKNSAFIGIALDKENAHVYHEIRQGRKIIVDGSGPANDKKIDAKNRSFSVKGKKVRVTWKGTHPDYQVEIKTKKAIYRYSFSKKRKLSPIRAVQTMMGDLVVGYWMSSQADACLEISKNRKVTRYCSKNGYTENVHMTVPFIDVSWYWHRIACFEKGRVSKVIGVMDAFHESGLIGKIFRFSSNLSLTDLRTGRTRLYPDFRYKASFKGKYPVFEISSLDDRIKACIERPAKIKSHASKGKVIMRMLLSANIDYNTYASKGVAFIDGKKYPAITTSEMVGMKKRHYWL